MSASEKRFQLILDDSGSRNPDHQPEHREDGMDWFALGGFLVEDDDVRLLIDQHRAFVDAWGIDYPLHSTRIRGRRNNFRWLGRDADRAARFYDELGALLTNVPALGIACVIDRPGYNGRYAKTYGNDRWLMCKTAFAILVERSAKYVMARGSKLEVYFEGVGPKEDQYLVQYHRDLKRNGMPFDRDRSAEYGSLNAKAFAEVLLGDAQRQTKASPLMQVADLYLYPMVKAGYGPYKPFDQLVEAGCIIDSHLDGDSRPFGGIKYSCFENIKKPDFSVRPFRSARKRGEPRGQAHVAYMTIRLLHCNSSRKVPVAAKPRRRSCRGRPRRPSAIRQLYGIVPVCWRKRSLVLGASWGLSHPHGGAGRL